MLWILGLCVAQAGSEPSFVDRTQDVGLSISGEGACWVDIDNDGFPDLCAGGAVWKNHAGRRFSKVADVGAVVAADFDNDGFADLYSWNQRKLYKNNQGKSFSEVPLPKMEGVSRGACWGDFDNDGFVDLYVGGFEDWEKQLTYPSYVLKNVRGSRFEIVRTEAKWRTRGVTASDYDQDGDLDVYASNYRLMPNQLWSSSDWKDLAAERNAIATSTGFGGGHSIGAAWGDFDNDGLIDLFAGNFAHVDSRGDQPKSRFLRNLGAAGGWKFDDLGTCGVFYQESYASPAAGDYDNDGDLDLFFTTVYADASFGKKNYPVLYRNDGKFSFADATAGAGLSQLAPTYQAAWADFDRDGDLELVTAGKLFVNRSQRGTWLQMELRGDGRKVNRSAIGAQVRIKVGGKTLTRQVEAGTGEGNQNDLVLHFGLGGHQGPLDAVITWPGGASQKVRIKEVNQKVEVLYKQ